jgi:hypothetical protein
MTRGVLAIDEFLVSCGLGRLSEAEPSTPNGCNKREAKAASAAEGFDFIVKEETCARELS